MTTTEPNFDFVSRCLALSLCLLMLAVGFWALLMPRSVQKSMIGLSSRLPDQSGIAPVVKFLTGRYFILLLRLFSLFPIAMAIGLFCKVAR